MKSTALLNQDIESFMHATITGDIAQLESRVMNNPQLLNAKHQATGLTALHFAAKLGLLPVVEKLLFLGAHRGVYNNEGRRPCDYFNPEATTFSLLAPVEIVRAVTQGNIARVKEILATDSSQVNFWDSNFNTPLFHAAAAGHEDIVKFLIEEGAEVDWINAQQQNVLQYAKLHGKNTASLSYLKTLINLTPTEISTLTTALNTLLKREYETAKAQGKKLLILIGEVHSHYKGICIEKKILDIAHALGINNLHVEHRQEVVNEAKKFVLPHAKKKQFTLKGNDDHWLHLLHMHPTVQQRNMLMAREINQNPKDNILIVGASHLKGLLTQTEDKINNNIYHIIPLSLVDLMPKSSHYRQIMKLARHNFRDDFCKDAKKIIQISRKKISPSKKVIARWNKSKNKKLSMLANLKRKFFQSMSSRNTVVRVLPFSAFSLFQTGYERIASLSLASAYYIYLGKEYLGVKGLKKYESKNHYHSDLEPNKLEAFLDGAENSFKKSFITCFQPKRWRHMEDYYAGRLAAVTDEKEIIHSVKKARTAK